MIDYCHNHTIYDPTCPGCQLVTNHLLGSSFVPEPSEDSQRMVRHTVAARVASMESEKLYLQNLHGDISRLRLSIGDRIAALERQIAAEKASVPNEKAEL